ncbi:hypothetical protein [Paenibacillus kribbensis]|uniref:hypothetical protein n=1 Tax=Paenibacillus kribbensis TaxID=172713 RepID=UPI0015C03539|nr:hypothetical protein [Paenibacillus kribbensis]
MNECKSKFIDQVYPVTVQLAGIKPKERVAVCGFGLTSMDVISALTLGRGGSYFKDEHGVLKYHASGFEPKIFMFSRSGLPYRGRPTFSTTNTNSYQPVFFTYHKVDELRKSLPLHKALDFQQDILPILFAEMKFRFYVTAAQISEGDKGGNQAKEALTQAWHNGGFHQALNFFSNKYGTFDPESFLLVDWPYNSEDSNSYQKQFCDLVKTDLNESKMGLARSPLKAALELFRDLRGVIRYAVDHSGLEPHSHQLFLTQYTPLMNRMVAGPQKERLEELLALIDCSILEVPFGPFPQVSYSQMTHTFKIESTLLGKPISRNVDHICLAHIFQPSLEQSDSKLIQNLYKNERIRSYFNRNIFIGGIDLDNNMQPITTEGSVNSNIWVLGPLAEGVLFYNHYIPSPNSCSKAYKDANLTVGLLFGRIVLEPVS